MNVGRCLPQMWGFRWGDVQCLCKALLTPPSSALGALLKSFTVGKSWGYAKENAREIEKPARLRGLSAVLLCS